MSMHRAEYPGPALTVEESRDPAMRQVKVGQDRTSESDAFREIRKEAEMWLALLL